MPLKCAFFFLFLSTLCVAQTPELCNNALDDDQDGLIDLHDPDCSCGPALPRSPIPNPSFEDQSCCPHEPSGFACLSDWNQPSEPTVDYNHSCHWLEWQEYPIPLPLPDGEGCVGFRDGFFDLRNDNPQWKEYASTCLFTPLQADVLYTIELSIGFSDEIHSPPLQLAVFGIQKCDDMTFGEGNVRFGCPTKDPNWRFLGGVDVDGKNEWKRVQMTLKPREDISVIAIGPGCKEYLGPINTYYFLDHIVLIEQSNFEEGISLTDHPCATDVGMEVQRRPGYSYQWYKEGIALAGEESEMLSQLYGEGSYQVRLESPTGQCQLTEPFVFERPSSFEEQEAIICAGETYLLGIQELTETGIYLDTLQTPEGCDSVILLELVVVSDLGDSIDVSIFPSEVYQIGSNSFDEAGEYAIPLQSSTGCDSTIHLSLSFYEFLVPTAFSPNGDGINDYFSLEGDGDEVVGIRMFQVYNRWGNLIFQANNLTRPDFATVWNGQTSAAPAVEGVYVFVAIVLFDDQKERTSSGSFVLLR
ncbi:MAG: gliding motility-associated C-terminal domain-containing protein [Bacteroidota bacterium]